MPFDFFLGDENLEFLPGERGTEGQLAFGRNLVVAFDFDADEQDVAVLVDGPVGRLDVVADGRVGLVEVPGRRRILRDKGADGGFDFKAARLVEGDNTERLAGMFLGVLDSGLRNGHDFIGHDLQRLAVALFAVGHGQLLDAVVVDLRVREVHKRDIVVVRGEPEFAGRDALAQGRCENAFQEERTLAGQDVCKGVERLRFQGRHVRVADEDDFVRNADGRERFRYRDAVRVQDDGDVVYLVVHVVRLVERGDAQQFRVRFNSGMYGPEVRVGELV